MGKACSGEGSVLKRVTNYTDLLYLYIATFKVYYWKSANGTATIFIMNRIYNWLIRLNTNITIVSCDKIVCKQYILM